MSVTELAKITDTSADDVRASLDELESALAGRGTRLVTQDDKVSLATAPQARALIEHMRRDELEGAIGRAGLETLAVVTYQGPVTRADIEYIRGVNVSTTLRTLLMRGLVERIDNPKDKRSFLYRASVELAAYFGVSKLTDLPDYQSVRASLDTILIDRPAEEPVDSTNA